MMMTADELKRHLSKLCKRLNGDDLLISLSGFLGDTDAEIVEKKLRSTEPNALTIMYMYTAVKRRMGSDHVQVFIQAVRDQFPDLRSLGIMPANNAERAGQFPIHRQPDPPCEASATPQYRRRDSERSIPGPVMQTQPVPSRDFAYPPSPACDQRSFGLPGQPPNTHPDFPPSSYRKWSSWAPSHLKYSGGYSNPQCDDWNREIQRPRNSKAPEAGFPYPLTSNGALAFTDPDRVSYPEQSKISMADIVANITGKGTPDPPQCGHALQVQTHLSELSQDRGTYFQSKSKEQFMPGSLSKTPEDPSITETARATGNANCVCGHADLSLNILASVEDNSHVDMSTWSARQTSSEAARPLGLSGPPSLSLDKSNIQTDADLPTEDVQPEQPDDVENSNYVEGTRGDLQQAIVPPQDPMDRTPSTTNVYIERVVVKGEGNNVHISAQSIVETVFRKQGQQISPLGYEDELPTRFEALSVHDEDVLEPTQSSERPQPGQNTYIPIQSEPPLNLSPSKSANHQTLPKAVDQTMSELAPPQTDLQNLGCSLQFLEHRSEQIVPRFPGDTPQCQTLLTESSQNRQNSAVVRNPPFVSDMSLFSSGSSHHNTKLKGKRQSQAEEANTTETKQQNQSEEADTTETKQQNQSKEANTTETKRQKQSEEADTTEIKWQNQSEEADTTEIKWQNQSEEADRTETNLRKSDPVQVADMRTGNLETRLQEQRCSQSCRDPWPSEADSLQTTDYPTHDLLKPGCLLGPEELLNYEAQRDESVELPSHLVLS